MNTLAIVRAAGNASVALNASTYTALNAQPAFRVHVTNTATESVAVQVKQDAGSAAITVPAATTMTFSGLRDASQLSVLAAIGTPTLSYRWEH
jgi:P pilus assembly chaperone PapD